MEGEGIHFSSFSLSTFFFFNSLSFLILLLCKKISFETLYLSYEGRRGKKLIFSTMFFPSPFFLPSHSLNFYFPFLFFLTHSFSKIPSLPSGEKKKKFIFSLLSPPFPLPLFLLLSLLLHTTPSHIVSIDETLRLFFFLFW